MLARLYSLNYRLELFDLETPIEKAATFAERGLKLDPTNQPTGQDDHGLHPLI